MNGACAIALKIAKILAAQASAPSFKDDLGASATTNKIVAHKLAAQVPISDSVPKFLRRCHGASFVIFLEHRSKKNTGDLKEKKVIAPQTQYFQRLARCSPNKKRGSSLRRYTAFCILWVAAPDIASPHKKAEFNAILRFSKS